MSDAQTFVDMMTDGHPLTEGQVVLDLGGLKIALKSNSHTLLERLGIYFAHVLGVGPADIDVLAIERDVMDLGVDFVDWAREPGKTGRKDAYFDLEGERLVQKVRTGMVFLQSKTHRIAAGPCLEFDNQVINFINAQYMNWLQQNGQLICHASGLVMDDRCLAMAGLSGGGKSTLMLNMMDEGGVHYLTNDRLFLSKDGARVKATGIPKLPRINPGTIVHNPVLEHILPEERVAELLALPKNDLWDLEEKYDVDVEGLYGESKITPVTELAAFLVLHWDRGSDVPCTVKPADLAERSDLLGAIMKSPGPFYQFKDGSFFQDDMPLDPTPYLDILADIPVFEATGGIDFDAAARFCLDHMKAKAA